MLQLRATTVQTKARPTYAAHLKADVNICCCPAARTSMTGCCMSCLTLTQRIPTTMHHSEHACLRCSPRWRCLAVGRQSRAPR